MRVLFIVLILALNFFILWSWSIRFKKKGKKYAWYWGWILPTDIIALTILSIMGLFVSGFFIFNTFPLNQKRTEREMKDIKQSLIKYKNDEGQFPDNIEMLIGQRPLRRDWKSDAWNTNYLLGQNRMNTLILISAGSDKLFDTEDDIEVLIK